MTVHAKTQTRLLAALILTTALMGCRNDMPHSVTWPASGDTVQSHPKPPEGGYYTNWDPFAVKLEVFPKEDKNPIRTQHVIVATVRDADGKPLPNRRVEWMLAEGGVGDIVEVDESGWRASRGYKVIIPAPTFVSPDSPIEEPSPTSDSDLTDITFGYIRELSEELGPRESGTEQERLAAEYLASKFESFGYSVEVQPFISEFVSPNQTSLTLDVPGPEHVEAMPLAMSGSGRVSGNLVPIRLGLEEDIPEDGLKGKIALVKRGLITFEQKVNRASSAGAIGVVIYNNEPGNFRGALLSPGQIPAISISEEDGERIEQLLSKDTFGVTISIETEKHPSQNVIAEKPGLSEMVVILGAHYDTVPNVPGANDNASGTAVLLTLAEALSQTSFPFGLRFITFGSEELGLRGSQAYTRSLSSEEPSRILAMLNFDALGSGDGLGVSGASDLTKLVVEQAKSLGIEVRSSEGIAGTSSDHASFARAGISVIVFFSNDASGIHTPQDTIDLINPKLPGDAARLALALLTSLAANG